MNKSEIKVRIKQINSELDTLLQQDRLIKSKQYDAWITDLLLEMNENGVSDWPWVKLIDSVSRKTLNREKQSLEYQLNPQSIPAGSIGSDEIARAKAVPIEQILVFNSRGTTVCFWHDDTRPSMRLFKKNNKVKCFSCGHVADTIDVTMKLYNLNLPQAVKRLLNM